MSYEIQYDGDVFAKDYLRFLNKLAITLNNIYFDKIKKL
jgi:hypothetical protein